MYDVEERKHLVVLKQEKMINELMGLVAIKENLYEAKVKRSQELSKRLNEA